MNAILEGDMEKGKDDMMLSAMLWKITDNPHVTA